MEDPKNYQPMATLRKLLTRLETLQARLRQLDEMYEGKTKTGHYHVQMDSITRAAKILNQSLNNMGRKKLHLVRLGVSINHIFDSSKEIKEETNIMIADLDEQEIKDWASLQNLVIVKLTKIPTMELLTDTRLTEVFNNHK